MRNIGVLVSGGGTNFQAIIDAVEAGIIDGNICVVISNKEDAYGLERGKKHGIKAIFENDEKKIIEHLKANNVDLVVLAGFLKILTSKFVDEFKNKIINIHPSLIPSFCGKGHYGLKVHEKAVEYGVKVSGATVHFVDENADTGPILMQGVVDVYPEDNAKDLQARVLKIEHKILVKSVKLICDDKVKIVGRKVFINE